MSEPGVNEPSAEANANVVAAPWASAPEEQLLATRICDLAGLRIAGSELEPRILQLHDELESRKLTLRPTFYLGDEWFSPEGVPAVSIPFYLAHPRLKALEQKIMMEVEGGDPAWCQRLLRHECGHAIEHAFELHKKKKRKELFGPRSADYDPDTYRPHPYSRSFVRNLPNWYAQAHPDEDFAETFAVWLAPEDWRRQYKGWKALAKLEYVDTIMKEIAGKAPIVTDGPREYEVSKIRITLDTYYRRRKKLYATDAPDFYDRDLKSLFELHGDSRPLQGESRRTAAAFMKRQRKQIIHSVSRWTGEHKVTIEHLVKKLTDRAAALSLHLARDEAQTSIEVAAYLATLVTHYRFTGKFKRTV